MSDGGGYSDDAAMLFIEGARKAGGVALVVAGVALLIAAVGAILALLAGDARFIEVAWVSIAASLFVLAWASLERKE